MAKPKVAFYWNASCGGCEEAVVDLAEDILTVVDAVEFVLWPVAMDFKREDVEALDDGEIAVAFLNGSVRTSEQEDWARLLRRKAGLVVAFGSCAHLGGIPGLANFSNREGVFEASYGYLPSVDNPEGVVPQTETKVKEGTLELPEIYDTVYALDQVVDVDYYLPGCAPPADLILDAVNAILSGELPPKGTVLAPTKSLCDECDRNESKPDKIEISELKRPHQTMIDPEKCFLAEGIICMGPATRAGCGERCINANMPCRGCFGPTDEVRDQSAKFLSALASVLDVDEPEEMERLSESIPDVTGLFAMYSLPVTLLKRRKLEK
ncbi:MAG: oxidoreductase [Candidatus Eisenbacteria bacterium]|nr:oxidoreductase [Candidatus Eisenbacteria bacterium]